jgi:hypothetical protein
MFFGPGQGFLAGIEFVLELLFADFAEESAHKGAGFHAQREQVVAGEKGRTELRLLLQLFGLLDEEIVDIEAAVRAKAVEAMEFEFERESGTEEQSAERGFPHFKGVLELHVIANSLGKLFDLFAGEAEAFEDDLGHFRADFFMGVEMDFPAARVMRGGDGLGDIVEEDCPGQRRVGIRRQVPEHQLEVIVDGAFRVKLGGLFATDGGGDFGEDVFQEVAFAE